MMFWRAGSLIVATCVVEFSPCTQILDIFCFEQRGIDRQMRNFLSGRHQAKLLRVEFSNFGAAVEWELLVAYINYLIICKVITLYINIVNI